MEKDQRRYNAELKGQRMVEILRSLDLSKRSDVKRMYELSRECMSEPLKIRNPGSPNIRIRDLMMVSKLTEGLERIAASPQDMRLRLETNGHDFAKLGGDVGGVYNWVCRYDYKEVIEDANSGNSNLFLAVMGASADLASQALSRHDTGLFLRAMERELRAIKPEETEELKYRIPIRYPNLIEMVETQEKFFHLWNRVMLKYLSNLIQKPGFVLSGESETKDVRKLCNSVPTWVVGMHELTSIGEGHNYQLFNSSYNQYIDEVEEKARLTSEKIMEFNKVLEEYDSKVDFIRPK